MNINKQYLFFYITASIAVLVVIVLTILTFLPQQAPQQNIPSAPLPTVIPIPTIVQSEEGEEYSLKDITIGITTQSEVEQLLPIREKVAAENDITVYKVGPELFARLNEVRVKNGRAIFKRERLLPEAGYAPPTFSLYTQKLGNPEEKIKGSLFYGENAVYYLYPSKGVVLIGNEHTTEVFEIQEFTPMSLDEYKKLFGSDIDENPDTHVY